MSKESFLLKYRLSFVFKTHVSVWETSWPALGNEDTENKSAQQKQSPLFTIFWRSATACSNPKFTQVGGPASKFPDVSPFSTSFNLLIWESFNLFLIEKKRFRQHKTSVFLLGTTNSFRRPTVWGKRADEFQAWRLPYHRKADTWLLLRGGFSHPGAVRHPRFKGAEQARERWVIPKSHER